MEIDSSMSILALRSTASVELCCIPKHFSSLPTPSPMPQASLLGTFPSATIQRDSAPQLPASPP